MGRIGFIGCPARKLARNHQGSAGRRRCMQRDRMPAEEARRALV